MKFGLLAMVLALFFNGCVGITTFKGGKKEVLFTPNLKSNMKYETPTRNDYTKFEIYQMWGEANEKIESGRQDAWIYRDRFAWSGAVLWLGVPLPFLLPIGMRETVVFFEEGVTSSVLYESTNMGGTVCGPLLWLQSDVSGFCHTPRN